MAEPRLAGPELDAEVERKVFGHGVLDGTAFDPATHNAVDDVPPYSTSWAAMGELVEYLRGQGWDYTITSTRGDGLVGVCLMREPTLMASVAAAAPTAPHAVCLAALAARPTGDGGAG